MIATKGVFLFSQRAREYSLAYYTMYVTTAVNGSSINRTSGNRRDNAADSCDSTATFKLFIKLTGASKVHRLAMDFGDAAFCKSCL